MWTVLAFLFFFFPVCGVFKNKSRYPGLIIQAVLYHKLISYFPVNIQHNP